MSTVSEPKSKTCNRCGQSIIWNNANHYFESVAYPNFQHCCALPCNKAGCGGTIFFSKLCPVNPETNRPRPLDFPIPQPDPNNKEKKIWVVHVHKNNVAADVPTNETTVPSFPEAPAVAVPQTKPLPQGQNTLEYVEPAPQTNVVKNIAAQTENPDAQGAILTTLNSINLRLGMLEKYFNDVVPTLTGMMDRMDKVIPALQVITGKIADNSIQNASDLVQHNLSERAEQNLQ